MRRLIILILSAVLLLTSCNLVSPKPQDEEPPSSNTEPPSSNAEQPTEPETPEEANIEPEEESRIIKLVVPEGFTAARIGMRLEELGVCTVDEFLEAAQTGDYSGFPLVAQQEPDPNRCFSLEGYLFPDTYEIYRDESPESIIKKMLNNTEDKFSGELRKQITESGYTIDEIITIASIIQKEAYERNDNPVPQEMPRVSSVLHNRLDDGMMLQCNVTATYVKGVLAEFTEDGFERYNEFYNTYHCPALPVGAICNPSMDAIVAAVAPEDTDYLFFLTDKDKNFYYSSDYGEHQKLVAKYLPDEG